MSPKKIIIKKFDVFVLSLKCRIPDPSEKNYVQQSKVVREFENEVCLD